MFNANADRAQPEWWLERQKDRLPGLIGVTPTEFGEGFAVGRLELRPELRAPNGFLHAETVIALADTLCVYGCVEKWWGWWFPLVVVITGGPIGSLIGDWIIRDRLKGKAA